MGKKKAAKLSPEAKLLLARLRANGKSIDPELVKASIIQMLNFGVKAS